VQVAGDPGTLLFLPLNHRLHSRKAVFLFQLQNALFLKGLFLLGHPPVGKEPLPQNQENQHCQDGEQQCCNEQSVALLGFLFQFQVLDLQGLLLFFGFGFDPQRV
jgi:hypothetical protein